MHALEKVAEIVTNLSNFNKKTIFYIIDNYNAKDNCIYCFMYKHLVL